MFIKFFVIINTMDKFETELVLLKQQLETEKKRSERLEKKLKIYEDKQEVIEQQQKVLSKEKITKFVDELMDDEDVNTFLPDYVEKKIYTNVLTMLMRIVEHSIEDLNVNFMGHRIKFIMEASEVSSETSGTGETSE